LIDKNTLLELYHFAAARNLLLDGVEPYKIEDGREKAYVHLTFTPTEIYKSYSHLSWADRIVAVKHDIDDMLKEVSRSGGEFRFTVWVDDEEGW